MVPYGADSLLVIAFILPFLGLVAVSFLIYARPGLRNTYRGVDDWLI